MPLKLLGFFKIATPQSGTIHGTVLGYPILQQYNAAEMREPHETTDDTVEPNEPYEGFKALARNDS
jgi:hypothetical protein